MPKGKTRRCKRCKKWHKITDYSFTGQNEQGKRYRRWVCKGCRNEIYKLRNTDNRAYTAQTYKILHSPSDNFVLGTVWFQGTVMDTLKDGNWTPGMWWLDMKTGSKYEVQGNEEVHLFVGIRDVKSEPQRLVRSYGDRQPPGGR